jgi:GAF domain-containing protein
MTDFSESRNRKPQMRSPGFALEAATTNIRSTASDMHELGNIMVALRSCLEWLRGRQGTDELEGLVRAGLEASEQGMAAFRRLHEPMRLHDRRMLEANATALVSGQQVLFDHLLAAAITATGADMGNLQLVDSTTGALRIVSSHGFRAPFLSFFAEVRVDDASACGAALNQGHRIIVSDVSRSEIFSGTDGGEILRYAGVRAVQSTPLFDRAGCLFGMISTHWASPWAPSDNDLSLLDKVLSARPV